jgi:hypothetical protein
LGIAGEREGGRERCCEEVVRRMEEEEETEIKGSCDVWPVVLLLGRVLL